MILRVLFAGVVLSSSLTHRPDAPAPAGPMRVSAPQDDGRIATVLDQQGNAQVRPAGRRRWSPLFGKTPLWTGDEVRTSPRGANAVEIEGNGWKVTLGPGAAAQFAAGSEKGSDGASVLHVRAGEVEVNPGKTALQVRGPGGYSETLRARKVLRASDTATETLATDPRWLTGYRGSTTSEWMGSLLAKVDGRDVPLYVGYHKVTVEIRDQIARTTVEQSFVNSTPSRLEGTFFFPLPSDASISGFGMWIGDELVEADIVEKQRARAIFEQILRERRDPGLLEWAGGNLFKARVFPIEPHSEKRVLLRYTQVLPLAGDEVVYRYALRSELLRTRPLRELGINVAISSTVPITAVTSPTHAVRSKENGGTALVDFDAREYTPERDFEVRCKLAATSGLTVLPHRRGDDGYFAVLFSAPAADTGPWRRELVADGKALDVVIVADTSASMDGAARAAQANFIDALLGLLGAEDRFQLVAADVDATPLCATQAVSPAAISAALSALNQRPSLGWTDLDRALDVALAGGAERTVIYVGDGIPTARGDSNPDALAQRVAARVGTRPVHAVSVAATFESKVLRAMTAAGGSVREAGAAPARTALDLVAELAQPPVKDLRVRFEGVQTARVYPATLPNLAAGAQQFVLGRYLPAATAQRGRVIVTGVRDGTPIEHSASVELPSSDAGNSFLPRLWARQHLDALLAQGDGGKVKDDVISLSVEFGILTPFTSFLVLESDADRERFGVTRTVKMRDGEQFFADARDRANQQARRAQMQAARAWRLQLRARMLAELAQLGEDLYGWHASYGVQVAGAWLHYGAGGKTKLPYDLGAGGWDDRLVDGKDSGEGAAGPEQEEASPGDKEEQRNNEVDMPAEPAAAPVMSRAAAEKSALRQDADELGARRAQVASEGWFAGENKRGRFRDEAAAWSQFAFAFPPLAAAPEKALPAPTPDWPQDVLAALRAIDLRARLAAHADGLRVSVTRQSVHRRRGHVVHESKSELTRASTSWSVQAHTPGEQRQAEWNHDGERGVALLGQRLGRRRSAVPADAEAFPSPWGEAEFDVRAYAAWRASLDQRDGDVVEITLRPAGDSDVLLRLRIDTKQGVLLARTQERAGVVESTTRCSEFITAGGATWPGRIETESQHATSVGRVTCTVEAMDLATAAAAVRAVRAQGAGVLFAGQRPELAAAKQAVAERKATLDDHVAVVEHFASSQQWERALAAFAGVEAAGKDSAGLPWLRATLLWAARQGEAGKTIAQALAAAAAKADARDRAFLAAAILRQAGLHGHELLDLLEILRAPLQDDGADAQMRRAAWHTLRADALASVGRWQDVAGERTAVLALRPFDFGSAMGLAYALEHAQQFAALATCYEQIAGWRGGLEPEEANQLFERWTQALWHARDTNKLVEVAQRWRDASPQYAEAHMRWLSALLFANRQREADAWMAAVLQEPLAAKDAAQTARLSAATRLAVGQGWQFYAQELDPTAVQLLSAAMLRLLDGDAAQLDVFEQTFHQWHFQQTDACAALRKEIVARLLAPDTMARTPVDRLTRWLRWAQGASLDDAQFAAIKQGLRARFDAAVAGKSSDVETFGQAFLAVCRWQGRSPDVAPFLRAWLALAPAPQVPALAQQLFDALGGEPWTPALEAEMLALLPRWIPSEGEAAMQHQAAANAARAAAVQLALMRERHALGPVAELEKLARSERSAKEKEARQQVRSALAAVFAAASQGASEVLQPWLQVEGVCFAARAAATLRAVDGDARELFARAANAPALALVRERCAVVIAFLATRRTAHAELRDAAVRWMESKEAEKDATLDWRTHLVRLLIALDRHDAVIATLQRFVVASEVANPWRVPLGYFLAERGDLRAAADLLTTAATLDELDAAGWRTLAAWRLVLGDDAGAADAERRSFAVTQEWQLAQQVQAAMYRLQARRDAVPDDLDPSTLVALRELLRKASQPESYVYLSENLYRATKDFRTLTALAEAALGHSPQQIYPMLQRACGVFAQVHEEATCDALLGRIAELRAHAQAATDRRALDLLEVVVARRAAKVKNAPQEHARRALACLQSAARDTFLPGEPALYASLLASLEVIEDAALATEQRQQLRALHVAHPPRDADGLAIAHAHADLTWRYDEQDAALDALRVALDTYRRARGGLDAPADAASDLLVRFLTNRQRFADAEAFLRGEVGAQTARDRKDRAWLALANVWVQAVAQGGATALGRGAALYAGAKRELQDTLFQCRPNLVGNLLGTFVQLHREAARVGIAAARGDLAEFARGAIFELSPRVAEQSANMFTDVAQALAELGAPLPAIDLLVTRLEREPAWVVRCGHGGWQHFGYRLAQLRAQHPPRGDLAARLLRVALAALERDLTTGQGHSRALFAKHQNYWAEHEKEYVAVADAVVARASASGARRLHVADYLWNGLELRERAIDVLRAGEELGVLHEEGRQRLVAWLMEVGRPAQALPLARALSAAAPDHLEHRCTLARVLHAAKVAGAEDVLAQGEQRLRQQASSEATPHEHALARLAHTSLACELHARAARLFGEVIALHTRGPWARGAYDNALVSYYDGYARALVALERFDDAVDAASAAVVAWGTGIEQHRQALAALQAVLAQIDDLPGWLARYDARAAAAGADAPALRSALARVFAARTEHAAAAAQWRAALALQPLDEDAHAGLVTALDALREARAAADAVLASTRAFPLRIAAYADLGARYEQLGDRENAERAWTSTVEVLPDEADGHRRLAEHRRENKRYGDEVLHRARVVEIRSDEPDGLLLLAQAQLDAGDPAAAHATLQRVLEGTWDARFGDVKGQAARLRAAPPR